MPFTEPTATAETVDVSAAAPPDLSTGPPVVPSVVSTTGRLLSEPAAVPPEARWVELCGVRVARLTTSEFHSVVQRRLQERSVDPLLIGSVNLDHIHHFGRRGGLEGRHRRPAWPAPDEPWLMVADGVPICRRASAVTGRPWPRLTGADLLPLMLDQAMESGIRVGFLGGSEATATALRRRLDEQWPGLAVAGQWTPDRADILDPRRSTALARTIADAQVDLLVVGLGKPLQESWMQAYGQATGAQVLAAFGAAADFLAGATRRAPRWMRAAGLEWLFRLLSEPRRLARRYLVQGPAALIRLRVDHPESG